MSGGDGFHEDADEGPTATPSAALVAAGPTASPGPDPHGAHAGRGDDGGRPRIRENETARRKAGTCVERRARVERQACIDRSASVEGNTRIEGSPCIEGSARVGRSACVSDEASVGYDQDLRNVLAGRIGATTRDEDGEDQNEALSHRGIMTKPGRD